MGSEPFRPRSETLIPSTLKMWARHPCLTVGGASLPRVQGPSSVPLLRSPLSRSVVPWSPPFDVQSSKFNVQSSGPVVRGPLVFEPRGPVCTLCSANLAGYRWIPLELEATTADSSGGNISAFSLGRRPGAIRSCLELSGPIRTKTVFSAVRSTAFAFSALPSDDLPSTICHFWPAPHSSP